MSVEDAKAALELEAEREFCRRRESHGHEVTAWLYRIDRLILEVQAEMPCYHEYACGDDCDHYGVACPGYEDGRVSPESSSLCPSCTARMKLKETIDAR